MGVSWSVSSLRALMVASLMSAFACSCGGSPGKGGTGGTAGNGGGGGPGIGGSTAGAGGAAGGGGLPTSALYPVATRYAILLPPLAIAAADVNGDGRPDLVTGGCVQGSASGDQGTISVLINNGDGTFA